MEQQISGKTIPCFVDMERFNLCIAFEKHAWKKLNIQNDREKQLKKLSGVYGILLRYAIRIYNKHYTKDLEGFHERQYLRNQLVLSAIKKAQYKSKKSVDLSIEVDEEIVEVNGTNICNEKSVTTISESEKIILELETDRDSNISSETVIENTMSTQNRFINNDHSIQIKSESLSQEPVISNDPNSMPYHEEFYSSLTGNDEMEIGEASLDVESVDPTYSQFQNLPSSSQK